MAEVRPEGGDSGENALENGLLRLKEALLMAFRAGTRRREVEG
jgi:hypothetical protein